MKNLKESNYNWQYQQNIPPMSFVCGYCGHNVSSVKGYKLGEHNDGSGSQCAAIYICPHCKEPNYNDINSNWIPGQKVGKDINDLPEKIEYAYNEARECYKSNCFTASALMCRKLLMNIAVEIGADENLKFIQYVDFLVEQNFTPPNSKDWIDHIRTEGNRATHEIEEISQERCQNLITFAEMILIFSYEFPQKINKSLNS